VAPDVELTEQTKVELAVVMPQICDANPEHVIGKVPAPTRSHREAVG
jgi:hypothetical protein